MESINWFIRALKKYSDFKGRARRKEYWWFILINVLIIIALATVESVCNISQIELAMHLNIGLLNGTYMLIMLCPTLAVTTRRLHDTNRSGWWQLIYLLPIIGAFVIFIHVLEDSKPGDNYYGKNPRGRCLALH